jgi:hypothetical protein
LTQPVSNITYTQSTGSASTSAFITVITNRAPTSSDVNYPISKRWVDTTLGKEYILINLTSVGGVTQAVWLNLTNGTTSAVDTLSGNSGTNPVVPNGSGNINIYGDSTSIDINASTNQLTAKVILPSTDYSVLVGRSTSISGVNPSTAGLVLTSNGVSSLPSWQAAGSGEVVWSEKNANFTASANQGYFISAGTVICSLPTSPAEGTTVYFIIHATNSFTIQAPASTFIQIGTAVSTEGGACVSTSVSTGSSLTLVYMESISTWLTLNAPQNVWGLT